jgi:hypothetical protein
MDEGRFLRHNVSMGKIFNLFIFLISSSSWGEVSDLASCSQKYFSNEVQEERHFKVSRDGDRLFSRYRESRVDEYEVSDDVTIKVYQDTELEDFFTEEENKLIIEAFDSPRSKIKKVLFFGIEQQNRPEEDLNKSDNKYLFELWYGENEFSTTKVVLVRENIKACDNAKTFWPFLTRKY